MLFNSFEYIFAFLPLTFFAYFYFAGRINFPAAKCTLVFASLFFYSWWNIAYLPLLLFSVLFNFGVSVYLSSSSDKLFRKLSLIIGISGNLTLLGYFKYADFFLQTGNLIFQTRFAELNLLLPLAISFFTFQQIAFLVDCYRNETITGNFLDYCLFVTFFPQLIAGPIVHHKEMMPQFAALENRGPHYKNIATGIFVFVLGLFKKVVIADTFATWATPGFDQSSTLTFLEGWATSLSYTFQLYFDFSGYTDMALGAALLFNIRLPINFNSPYKALDIADFWRRWHMTLGRFFKDYVYIPLGGNRHSAPITLRNLLITFFLVGLWHGQEWMFVFWGLLHGAAMVVHRMWKKLNSPLPGFLAWFITFNFINISWVFFRATSWPDAMKVLKAMFGFNGIDFSHFEYFPEIGVAVYGVLLLSIFYTVTLTKNSNSFYENFSYTPKMLLIFFALFSISYINISQTSEFLYFRF
ncbi:MAG: MBOAT family protein [Candidatus Nitrohelix vancouverensis]|uniref:MBOAT family protein n=1 Tax=Candidatus Nitrohelix vancouverensis TaxID=2705534 RepID=A0A7T0G284_9BACT|nr:MAG: MBOAT family protein [Candidatus Nitrohelix vancouverensis]